MNMAELTPVMPEIFLSLVAMALLVYGAFRETKSLSSVSGLAILALLACMILLATRFNEATALGDMFIADSFSVFIKILVLLGSLLAIILSLGYLRLERIGKFEYPVLILLATVGMMVMVSANDLLILYLGLELQSLALYVLAAFQRRSSRATEAGLKYFVLGALSSGMLLYGCSLIYGFTGTTSFPVLVRIFVDGTTPELGLLIGLVFLLAGLAFKISAVPFHMWTPDVYEGAPTPVTAFFAVAPKIAAMALLVRTLMSPFGELTDEWRQIIVLLSIASILLGSVAAIGQSNIKRLMAYSSIGHIGYALIGLATGTSQGIRGILIYLAIYLVMNIGTFAIILCMRRREEMVETIEDLSGLSTHQPMMAMAMAIFMFSLAGIPPLAGFFAKFYVFAAAIEAKLYTLAVIGVLGSVIGAYYYLRIVKVMYFDPPADPFERPVRRDLGWISALAALLTLLFFVYPAPLLGISELATASLFP